MAKIPSSTNNSQRRTVPIPMSAEAASEPTPVANPEWLPADWKVEYKIRKNGATKDRVDKFYISPADGKFRSKAEVLRFLKTVNRNHESASEAAAAAALLLLNQRR